ncbi:polymer-forming cytoskeletal protein [Vibrio sp. ZSDZ65]|uniref:Polymer-forming cytoskeletal protein n=1 Tax=Vibrio qingdaonensis TaxID=2829491 RepID=A0A9X3HXN6_9VIBR|nr:polymer-forming cytoskeletal protein [Vibrio qingdaonensis]MCW8347453.1 polymer-forming cytoskeletal protein [Vibrio qingdaonensis]
MGIFSKNSGTTSRATTTTLIAKGCTISGKLKLENDIQVDGYVDGQVNVEGAIVIAESGRVKGEVFAKHVVINGMFEGDCHADHIQILSNGSVKGKIWSNNLSIDPGGSFFGETAGLAENEVVELGVKKVIDRTKTSNGTNIKTSNDNNIKASNGNNTKTSNSNNMKTA